MIIESNRRMLNYLGLFALIIFNAITFGFLAYIGSNLIESTKNSKILEVPQSIQSEMPGQKK